MCMYKYMYIGLCLNVPIYMYLKRLTGADHAAEYALIEGVIRR